MLSIELLLCQKISWHWVDARFCKTYLGFISLNKLKVRGCNLTMRQKLSPCLFIYSTAFLYIFFLQSSFTFIFGLFSLKILCFGPRFYFLEFERVKVIKNDGREKTLSLLDLVDKNDQIWCQRVPLDQMSVIEVFLSFHILKKKA